MGVYRPDRARRFYGRVRRGRRAWRRGLADRRDGDDFSAGGADSAAWGGAARHQSRPLDHDAAGNPAPSAAGLYVGSAGRRHHRRQRGGRAADRYHADDPGCLHSLSLLVPAAGCDCVFAAQVLRARCRRHAARFLRWGQRVAIGAVRRRSLSRPSAVRRVACLPDDVRARPQDSRVRVSRLYADAVSAVDPADDRRVDRRFLGRADRAPSDARSPVPPHLPDRTVAAGRAPLWAGAENAGWISF